MQDIPFEHRLILDTVGEDLYHELCCNLGGLQFSFKKSNKSSVIYYHQQGLSIKEIAHKMHVSEIFVRNTIRAYLQSRKNNLID